MILFNIFIGIITLLSFFFLIFPISLEVVKEMDTYRLIVLSVFIASFIYWAYIFIISFIQRRNPLKVLMNLKTPIQVIKCETYCYLVEGNGCFHIPDPETYNYLGSYLGFSWNDLEIMTPNELKRKFNIGKQLPSIRLYLPKIENKKGI